MRGPVTARSKAWVRDRPLPKIAGSNSAKVLDVHLLWVLCIVTQRSLRRADLSSREVPPRARACVSLSFIKDNNNLYTCNK